jgi:hypothetical protein
MIWIVKTEKKERMMLFRTRRTSKNAFLDVKKEDEQERNSLVIIGDQDEEKGHMSVAGSSLVDEQAVACNNIDDLD